MGVEGLNKIGALLFAESCHGHKSLIWIQFSPRMLALSRKGELCRAHLFCQKNVRRREAVRWGEREIVRTWEMEGMQGHKNEDRNTTHCEILKSKRDGEHVQKWMKVKKRNGDHKSENERVKP